MHWLGKVLWKSGKEIRELEEQLQLIPHAEEFKEGIR